MVGTDIPLESRIIAVADVFEALTAYRPYKGARRAANANEIMEEMSGKHLDPDVVKSLVNSLSL